MSDEEPTHSSDSGTRLLTAEFKDGQLEILAVSPAKKRKIQPMKTHMIAESSESTDEHFKYVQVLDSDKNVVVDLLNLTLVKCGDGEESYRLVSNPDSSGDGDETVTCVLANDDGDEQDQDAYVVMEGSEGPVVFLQSSLPQPEPEPEPAASKEAALTPMEILERAKSLQTTKSLLSANPTVGSRGRRRKSQIPPPHELLSSPHFKLYLYSCKMCTFKCNAIKELTAHKAAEHSCGGGKWRAGSRASAITLQCARCPFRGNTHSQLMKHVKEKHIEVTTVSTSKGLLESAEVNEADVLVCGACGFESSEREVFKIHIEEEHGVTAC